MGRSAEQERLGPAADDSADDTGCHVLHVDMDAFFVSVEVRKNPQLRGKPVIVGGVKGAGVVSSASYEARRYGVRSAMPMSRALSLCPSAITISGQHGEYSAASREVMELLRDVTPRVQPLSLDEAFLDVRGAQRLMGSPRQIAVEIRRRMEAELSLTCSIGVSNRMFVAKIASTRCKPDGLLVVAADQTLQFLRPLPVSALWGVGPKSAQRLEALGLRTVGDLETAREQTLISNLGPAQAHHLMALARGHDPRTVSTHRQERSIGAEQTFFHPLTDQPQIETSLRLLAQKVGTRMRRREVRARTVSVKIRTSDFETITRAQTLRTPTDVAQVLADSAVTLWKQADQAVLAGRPIRLVGVRAHGLAESDHQPVQLTLTETDDGRWARAERAMDAVAAKFGQQALRRGAQIRVRRGEDSDDHQVVDDPGS